MSRYLLDSGRLGAWITQRVCGDGEFDIGTAVQSDLVDALTSQWLVTRDGAVPGAEEVRVLGLAGPALNLELMLPDWDSPRRFPLSTLAGARLPVALARRILQQEALEAVTVINLSLAAELERRGGRVIAEVSVRRPRSLSEALGTPRLGRD